MTGRRLGAYEIQGLLGVGGMGQVYRGRDTRLQRDVAIKVLPSAVASDPERLARFEREAQLLASLNHPHIAAVYGLEDGPLEAGHSVRAIVMELVDGETLADRIARGPLPVGEALHMARQIADALDTAHEKGIIHRDLKPANIKITPDGTVKVLDFGLAKLVVTSDADVTAMATREGAVVGTPAYMSPEQARGQAVDKRTDIWAFGSVLYELLTGRPALDSPEWRALPRDTPPGAERLLRRCLVSNPTLRLRDLGDIDLALDAPVSGTPKRSRRRGLEVVAGLAAIAAAAAVWLLWSSDEAFDLRVGPMTRLTSDGGLASGPTISPDGRLIAYASDRGGDGLDIWVQQSSGGPPVRLTASPEADYDPEISPDGSLVAFRSERNPAGVYVVPALGGDARLIAPAGRAPKFSPDGGTIAFWLGSWLAPRGVNNIRRIGIVPTVGGDVRELSTDLASVGDPVWAPDGRSLLAFGRRATTGDLQTDWWMITPGEGAARRTGAYARLEAAGIDVGAIDDQPTPEQWTEDGVLFVGRASASDARAIWSIPLDQRTGIPGARPVQVTTTTAVDESPSVARDGRLVFSAQSEDFGLFGLPLDADAGRADGPLRLLRPFGARTGRSAISRDGRTLVFYLTLLGRSELWVRELASGRERQLAVTQAAFLNPVISPDGLAAAYTVTRVATGGSGGRGDGYVIALGGGTPRRVCETCEVWSWLDAGHVFIHGPSVRELYLLNLNTGSRQPLVTASEFVDRPLITPDRRFLLLNVGPDSILAPFRPERPLAEDELKAGVVLDRRYVGRHAGMSPDGRIIYLLLESDGFRCLYALRIDPMTGVATGEPAPVYHFHDPRLQWGSTGLGNAVADGWFVSNQSSSSGDIWMTTLTREESR